MRIVEALDKIKTKGVPPIVFMVGSDPFFCYEVVLSVRKFLESGGKNLIWREYEKYDKASSLSMTLAQSDLRFPLMVYLLRNADKAPAVAIKKFLDRAVKNTYILMQVEKVPEELQRKGMMVDCEPLNERKGEVEAWLMEEAKVLGFKLQETTARFMVGLFGNDLGVHHGELEKMAILFPKKEVSLGDVSTIMTSVSGISLPKLQSALVKKDKKLLLNLLRDAERDENLIGWVGIMFSFIDRWVVVRSVKTNDEKDIAQVLGKSPFIVHMDRESGKNFKAMSLWRASRLLALADRKLKMGMEAMPWLIKVVEELCV